jgi:hypothetical protein
LAATNACMMRDMSAQQSTAVPAPESFVRAFLARLGQSLELNGTLVMVVTTFAIVMLVAVRNGLVVDGWMALVSGREIAQHGLPTHDALTVWAHGRRWVDQQWLAQLLIYWLTRVGGFKLALLVHAGLGVGALAAAATAARRLGGSARAATWVCLPVLVAYYPEASVLRPQSFAYPLFVAVLWLLVTDSRAPSRRVFLVFPILALWANLHGSVLLGAGVVSLAGLVGQAEAVRAHPRRLSPRSLVLALGPWPCLLLSPYALHLPSYYEKILVGGDFSHFVTEWAPTTLSPTTAPVYLLVIAGMWLLGRAGNRVSTFEKLVFLASSVLAFQAVRNAAWLGLTALVVLPVLVDAVRRPAAEPRRLNRMLATVVLAGLVVTLLGVVANPPSWFTGGFPPAAAKAAETAAGPHGRILAMSPYADWLMWSRPGVQGRVAFDARFELYTADELSGLGAFSSRVGDWTKTARGFDVFVLGRRDNGALRTALVRSGVAQVVYADRDVVVLRRPR